MELAAQLEAEEQLAAQAAAQLQGSQVVGLV